MLVKTPTSSPHYHDAENHCASSSKSIEPLLKIKISRLKDGSRSVSLNNNNNNNNEQTSNNFEKRSAVSNQGRDSPTCETNELCCKIAENENMINDSEETEEEELNDDDDAANFVSLSSAKNNISLSKQNFFLKKKSPVKPIIKIKNLKKFSLNRVSMFANKNVEKSLEDSGSKSFKLLGSKSVGTMTDVDLLGPCQPGTFIKMPGFIWTDSAQNGMLLFKTTWKDQVYSGMLVEAAKEDWSFPKSRIFASCPGSRYKRKCKKPKEFNYIDSWKKRSRNAKQKARALRNLLALDEFASVNCSFNADHFDGSHFLLPCLHEGCYKKFTSFVARQFHVDNCHALTTKLMLQQINHLHDLNESYMKIDVTENIENMNVSPEQNDENDDADYIMRNSRWRKNTLLPKQTFKVLKCFEKGSKTVNAVLEQPVLQNCGQIGTAITMQSHIQSKTAITNSSPETTFVETNLLRNDISVEPRLMKSFVEDSSHYHDLKSVTSSHNSFPLIIPDSGSQIRSSSETQSEQTIDFPASSFQLTCSSPNLSIQSAFTNNCLGLNDGNRPLRLTFKCNAEYVGQSLQKVASVDDSSGNILLPCVNTKRAAEANTTILTHDSNSVILYNLDIPSQKSDTTDLTSNYTCSDESHLTSKFQNNINQTFVFPQSEYINSNENTPHLEGRKLKTTCPSPVYSDISDTVDEAPLFVNRTCNASNSSSSAFNHWAPSDLDNSSFNKWLTSSKNFLCQSETHPESNSDKWKSNSNFSLPQFSKESFLKGQSFNFTHEKNFDSVECNISLFNSNASFNIDNASNVF